MNDAYRNKAEEHLVHTYNRYPVVLERGEGVYLYDTEGKRYLDFGAGIAVCSLGYGHPAFTEALKEQAGKLLHTSNLYYSPAVAEAAQRLSGACGFQRVFFTNSGTEAIEGALKAARKYAFAKESGRFEIIAMNHSFHGRSMGALSVTGTEKYRTPFEPLIGGVRFADFNDIESVKTQINKKTCAVIVEPVQGEGGIYPADGAFLKALRKLCDENDVLLIFDEIQCGMGRTGTMFAWQGYGVKPDILCMAKAIGNGVPVGAFAITEEVAAHSLSPGDHGTTYGGNPFACAAVAKVIELFETEHILERVRETAAYLQKKLDALVEKYPHVTERRGIGLMQGLALKEECPAGELVKRAMERGLLLLTAGGNVVRIVPPLVIEKEHIDEMAAVLESCLKEQ